MLSLYFKYVCDGIYSIKCIEIPLDITVPKVEN